ncbi:hypothetical protein ACH47C_37895 [Streptomyces rishiriensis]|uniref:hypothetical protein n=1 Tax=Streptomyces rishiriensis TaxID=68264 RepID=UPI0033FF28CF
MRTTDPRTAMLLGVAAWRVAPLPEARRALLGSLAQAEHAIFTDPAAGDGPRRFLADSGRTLLSVEGRTWRTWDVRRARRTGSRPARCSRPAPTPASSPPPPATACGCGTRSPAAGPATRARSPSPSPTWPTAAFW